MDEFMAVLEQRGIKGDDAQTATKRFLKDIAEMLRDKTIQVTDFNSDAQRIAQVVKVVY